MHSSERAAISMSQLHKRSQRVDSLDDAEELVFQAIHWHGMDAQLEEEGEDEPQTAYTIKVFGADRKGRTIACTILGFTPYFYVKVPETWGSYELAEFRKFVTGRIRKRNARWESHLKSVRYLQRKDFWGYTHFREFRFIRLCFTTQQCARFVEGLLQEKVKMANIPGTHRLKLYESNMDPSIRFMHIQNLEPCGWIRLSGSRYEANAHPALASNCQIDVQCKWEEVHPVEVDTPAPFVLASFDIECMSHTGDFPVASKDYRKLCYDLEQLYVKELGGGASNYEVHERLVQAVLAGIGLAPPVSGIQTQRVEPGTAAPLEVLGGELRKRVDDLLRVLRDGLAQLQAKKPGMNHERIAAMLCQELSRIPGLPKLRGDEIIQIGTTFHVYGEKDCCYKHILTLGETEPFEGTTVVSCQSERELLLKWRDLVCTTNPDMVLGYNIFGFDFAYMVRRARELGIEEAFLKLGRFRDRVCRFQTKKLASSALGDNILEYIDMEGRTLIDLMKVVQRDHKLDSYKLDHVASTFMGENKNDVSPHDIFRLQKGSAADRRVIAEYCVQDCALCNRLIMKLEVVANNMGMANVCSVPLSYIFMRGQGIKIFSLVLKQCKEDGYLIPTLSRANTAVVRLPCASGADGDALEKALVDFFKLDIKTDRFQLVRETAASGIGVGADAPAETAFVCIVNHRYHPNELTRQIKRALNLQGMGDVPFELESEGDYKGVLDAYQKHVKRFKLTSTVVYTFEDEEMVAPEESGYEGAIVLDPQEGIYTDPVSVLDYASLYPSSMISENLSHDCMVLDPAYDNLPGVDYLNVSYDLYEGVGDKRHRVGEKTCRFVQLPDKQKGVLPRILMKLLAARKATRKRIQLKRVVLKDGSTLAGFYKSGDARYMPLAPGASPVPVDPEQVQSVQDFYDDFQKAVMDGLQLAYKVTANSLYGQMGARTSPLYLKDIAACTTATGRNMILKAKDFLETEYGHGARIVYGDTDSVFVTFDLRDPSSGEKLTGSAAIKQSIQYAMEASALFKKHLKAPHDLEYDKTFYPLILLSKKRYVGNLFEMDETAFHQKSMGIVLKRRDNAPIVKRVYGGIIDIILNRSDVGASVSFLNQVLNELVESSCPMEDLVISKSLRGSYKDPDRIAHKVLADRIAERNPGNKPQANDRIPYVYVYDADHYKKGAKVLQGNRIESPDYIREKSLVPDYAFYITNQIMKPVLQLYALVVEQLEGYDLPPDHFEKLRAGWLQKDPELSPKKQREKLDAAREEVVGRLLFDPVLAKLPGAKPPPADPPKDPKPKAPPKPRASRAKKNV